MARSRSILALVLAGAALLVSAPATASAGAVTRSDAPTAHAACSYARIQGQRKCIAAGQYCRHTSRANRSYHRYGYHCGKRDRRGSYHLIHR